jgi:DNA-binding response OmpR family regulator
VARGRSSHADEHSTTASTRLEVALAAGVVRVQGKEAHLELRALELLDLLNGRAPETCTYAEISAKLWADKSIPRPQDHFISAPLDRSNTQGDRHRGKSFEHSAERLWTRVPTGTTCLTGAAT